MDRSHDRVDLRTFAGALGEVRHVTDAGPGSRGVDARSAQVLAAVSVRLAFVYV